MAQIWQSTRRLLPFIGGVLCLLLLRSNATLAELEEKFFWFPERSQKEKFVSTFGAPLAYLVQVDEITPSSNGSGKGPRIIDQETREILAATESDLSATDWAYLFKAFREAGTSVAIVPETLSWPEAAELPLRALNHELASFDSSVMGISLGLGLQVAPIPEFLKSSSISPVGGFPGRVPAVSSLSVKPSADAHLYGFQNRFPDASPHQVQLLARWDDRLLISIELAGLLAHHGLSADDLILEPRGHLKLGSAGPVITIDEFGRTSVPPLPPMMESRSVADFLTAAEPEELPSTTEILATDPAGSTELDQHLTYFSRLLPRLHRIYRRAPIWQEALFLGILVFLLSNRRWWLPVLLLPAWYFLPTYQQIWLPLLPVIVTVLLSLALKRRSRNDSDPVQPV